MRDQAYEVENVVDLVWQSDYIAVSGTQSDALALLRTCCTLKQFILKNLNRVKPVQLLRSRTIHEAHSIVSFTEVPKSDCIVVVETQCLCNGVDEDCVGYTDGYYVGQIQSDEVYLAQ